MSDMPPPYQRLDPDSDYHNNEENVLGLQDFEKNNNPNDQNRHNNNTNHHPSHPDPPPNNRHHHHRSPPLPTPLISILYSLLIIIGIYIPSIIVVQSTFVEQDAPDFARPPNAIHIDRRYGVAVGPEMEIFTGDVVVVTIEEQSPVDGDPVFNVWAQGDNGDIICLDPTITSGSAFHQQYSSQFSSFQQPNNAQKGYTDLGYEAPFGDGTGYGRTWSPSLVHMFSVSIIDGRLGLFNLSPLITFPQSPSYITPQSRMMRSGVASSMDDIAWTLQTPHTLSVNSYLQPNYGFYGMSSASYPLYPERIIKTSSGNNNNNGYGGGYNGNSSAGDTYTSIPSDYDLDSIDKFFLRGSSQHGFCTCSQGRVQCPYNGSLGGNIIYPNLSNLDPVFSRFKITKIPYPVARRLLENYRSILQHKPPNTFNLLQLFPFMDRVGALHFHGAEARLTARRVYIAQLRVTTRGTKLEQQAIIVMRNLVSDTVRFTFNWGFTLIPLLTIGYAEGVAFIPGIPILFGNDDEDEVNRMITFGDGDEVNQQNDPNDLQSGPNRSYKPLNFINSGDSIHTLSDEYINYDPLLGNSGDNENGNDNNLNRFFTKGSYDGSQQFNTYGHPNKKMRVITNLFKFGDDVGSDGYDDHDDVIENENNDQIDERRRDRIMTAMGYNNSPSSNNRLSKHQQRAIDDVINPNERSNEKKSKRNDQNRGQSNQYDNKSGKNKKGKTNYDWLNDRDDNHNQLHDVLNINRIKSPHNVNVIGAGTDQENKAMFSHPDLTPGQGNIGLSHWNDDNNNTKNGKNGNNIQNNNNNKTRQKQPPAISLNPTSSRPTLEFYYPVTRDGRYDAVKQDNGIDHIEISHQVPTSLQSIQPQQRPSIKTLSHNPPHSTQQKQHQSSSPLQHRYQNTSYPSYYNGDLSHLLHNNNDKIMTPQYKLTRVIEILRTVLHFVLEPASLSTASQSASSTSSTLSTSSTIDMKDKSYSDITITPIWEYLESVPIFLHHVHSFFSLDQPTIKKNRSVTINGDYNQLYSFKNNIIDSINDAIDDNNDHYTPCTRLHEISIDFLPQATTKSTKSTKNSLHNEIEEKSNEGIIYLEWLGQCQVKYQYSIDTFNHCLNQSKEHNDDDNNCYKQQQSMLESSIDSIYTILTTSLLNPTPLSGKDDDSNEDIDDSTSSSSTTTLTNHSIHTLLSSFLVPQPHNNTTTTNSLPSYDLSTILVFLLQQYQQASPSFQEQLNTLLNPEIMGIPHDNNPSTIMAANSFNSNNGRRVTGHKQGGWRDNIPNLAPDNSQSDQQLNNLIQNNTNFQNFQKRFNPPNSLQQKQKQQQKQSKGIPGMVNDGITTSYNAFSQRFSGNHGLKMNTMASSSTMGMASKVLSALPSSSAGQNDENLQNDSNSTQSSFISKLKSYLPVLFSSDDDIDELTNDDNNVTLLHNNNNTMSNNNNNHNNINHNHKNTQSPHSASPPKPQHTSNLGDPSDIIDLRHAVSKSQSYNNKNNNNNNNGRNNNNRNGGNNKNYASPLSPHWDSTSSLPSTIPLPGLQSGMSPTTVAAPNINTNILNHLPEDLRETTTASTNRWLNHLTTQSQVNLVHQHPVNTNGSAQGLNGFVRGKKDDGDGFDSKLYNQQQNQQNLQNQQNQQNQQQNQSPSSHQQQSQNQSSSQSILRNPSTSRSIGPQLSSLTQSFLFSQALQSHSNTPNNNAQSPSQSSAQFSFPSLTNRATSGLQSGILDQKLHEDKVGQQYNEMFNGKKNQQNDQYQQNNQNQNQQNNQNNNNNQNKPSLNPFQLGSSVFNQGSPSSSNSGLGTLFDMGGIGSPLQSQLPKSLSSPQSSQQSSSQSLTLPSESSPNFNPFAQTDLRSMSTMQAILPGILDSLVFNFEISIGFGIDVDFGTVLEMAGECALISPPSSASIAHAVQHIGFSTIPFTLDLVRGEWYWYGIWIGDMHLASQAVDVVPLIHTGSMIIMNNKDGERNGVSDDELDKINYHLDDNNYNNNNGHDRKIINHEYQDQFNLYKEKKKNPQRISRAFNLAIHASMDDLHLEKYFHNYDQHQQVQLQGQQQQQQQQDQQKHKNINQQTTVKKTLQVIVPDVNDPGSTTNPITPPTNGNDGPIVPPTNGNDGPIVPPTNGNDGPIVPPTNGNDVPIVPPTTLPDTDTPTTPTTPTIPTTPPSTDNPSTGGSTTPTPPRTPSTGTGINTDTQAEPQAPATDQSTPGLATLPTPSTSSQNPPNRPGPFSDVVEAIRNNTSSNAPPILSGNDGNGGSVPPGGGGSGNIDPNDLTGDNNTCLDPFKFDNMSDRFTIQRASINTSIYSFDNPLGLEHPAFELHHFAMSGTYTSTSTFFLEFIIERIS